MADNVMLKCVICGTVLEKPRPIDWKKSIIENLDGKPFETEDFSIKNGVCRCDKCGFVSFDISKNILKDPTIMGSDAYREIINNKAMPDVVNNYLALGYIYEKQAEHYHSAHAYLSASWLLNTFKMEKEEKIVLEKTAFCQLSYINSDSFKAHPDFDMLLSSVDVLRRVEKYDNSKKLANFAISKTTSPFVREKFLLEISLCDNFISAPHKIKPESRVFDSDLISILSKIKASNGQSATEKLEYYLDLYEFLQTSDFKAINDDVIQIFKEGKEVANLNNDAESDKNEEQVLPLSEDKNNVLVDEFGNAVQVRKLFTSVSDLKGEQVPNIQEIENEEMDESQPCENIEEVEELIEIEEEVMSNEEVFEDKLPEVEEINNQLEEIEDHIEEPEENISLNEELYNQLKKEVNAVDFEVKEDILEEYNQLSEEVPQSYEEVEKNVQDEVEFVDNEEQIEDIEEEIEEILSENEAEEIEETDILEDVDLTQTTPIFFDDIIENSTQTLDDVVDYDIVDEIVDVEELEEIKAIDEMEEQEPQTENDDFVAQSQGTEENSKIYDENIAVIQTLAEISGEITIGDVQSLFDIGYTDAKNMLTDMVSRGMLKDKGDELTYVYQHLSK